jgi:DNA-binding Lrp family transcriptional regulator
MSGEDRPDWIEPKDIEILEYLNKVGSDSRMSIEVNLGGHPEHTGSRVRKLEENGILVNKNRRQYAITELGMKLLPKEFSDE